MKVYRYLLLLCVFFVPLSFADEAGDYLILVGGMDGPDQETYPVTETVARWMQSIIGTDSGIEIRMYDNVVPMDEFYNFYMEAYESGADKVVVGLYDIEGSTVSLRLASTSVSSAGLGSVGGIEVDDDLNPTNFNVSLLNTQSPPPAGVRFFAHSLAASTYYYSGKFEEALTEINYALEFGIGISAGDLSRVYYFRGLMQESTFNNPPAALADYDKALELDSSNYSALSDRAKVLSLLFRYEEAFEAYNTRIEIYPDSADAYSDRAIFLCEMGYFEEALPDILYAVELAPQDPYFGYDLGLCYAHMQEYENSIEAFSDVINMNPEYVHAYIDRAMVYLELEDYEKAQQDLLQALEIDDSMPRTYGGLELTCIELKQWEEGLEYSRIARELDPTNPNFAKAAGAIYIRMGDFDRALEELELAYEMIMTFQNGVDGPQTSLQVLINLIDELRELSEMDRNSSDYYYARGFQLSEVDLYSNAVIELNEAIRLDPDNENAYFLRGMCCMKTGNTAQAQADLETVINMTAISHRKRMAEQMLLQLTE